MKVSFVRRVRTINAGDAPEAAAFIRRFYPFADRLGHLLPDLLRRLLMEETLNGVVVEYVHDNDENPEIAAVGLSGFVSEACAKEFLASPTPRLEFTLLERARKQEPAFLTYDEIAEANAGEGLTLFPLFWLQRSNDPADPEAHILLGLGQQTFWRRHRGYRLSRVLKEVPAEMAAAFLSGGFKEHCRFPAGTPLGAFPDVALEQDRVIFTATPDVEASWPASVVGQLFAHQAPRCGFTRFERQVLVRAADGLTDAKIALALGISLTAVSLRWRSIYARLFECLPALLPSEDDSNGARGQEKRRTVIAFINEHPEELRPYARPVRRQNHNRVAQEA